ncbi:MAG: 2-succinyl-6-hydroxy-2,4-cyclohexadiene-1-carboxylate synthase [Deltaproteobacteria bacterium]|nr:2-succinyl-6-hydroxy-2,4-cyclohexadiene-1-carboxylate synthase [Deltaproteobacteria bacterium]
MMKRKTQNIGGEIHHASVSEGPSDRPVVLALHGFSGAGSDFEAITSHIDLEVVAPDILGHGDSPAPRSRESYRIDTVAHQVVTWTDDERPVFLLGYSMGGRIALRAAPLLQNRLMGLILISVNPGIEDTTERTERIARDAALAAQIEQNGIGWFTEYWSKTPLISTQKNIPKTIRDSMMESRESQRTHGLSGSLRGMGQGAVNPIWNNLPHEDTLLITGELDTAYTDIADRMCAVMPNATRMVVENAGHCTHLEDVETVGPAIQNFINRVIG